MRRFTPLFLVLAASAPRLVLADDPSQYSVDKVHDGLSLSVGLRFAPDGRMFYIEVYSGRVRYFPDTSATALAVTWTTVPVTTGPEKGLDGIAFHPQFSDSPFVYLYYTTTDATYGVHNRLVRMRDSSGVGTDRVLIGIFGTGTDHHNGGRLEFGPDQFLYVTCGDADSMANADNPNYIRGKILRYTAMGEPAPGNPIGPGNPVYAYGVRNSFGLCFDRVTGHGYFTDNGPSCDDELNYLQAGGDYGWGVGDFCGSQPAGTIPPMLNYTPTIAPTGCWVYRGSQTPSMQGNLFFGGFNDGILRRVFINASNPAGVDSVQDFPAIVGQLLDVTEGTAGFLWFCSERAIYRVRRNSLVGVDDSTLPRAFSAGPNPFRGAVSLSLPAQDPLRRVEVLDISGRRVRNWKAPSGATLVWDGRDADGHVLPAGVFLVRATTENGRVFHLRVVKLER